MKYMLFENLRQEYIKKGFTIINQRETKPVYWAHFEKEIEKRWTTSTSVLYIYFVDEDVNLKRMNEFLTKYNNFYENHDFDDLKCIFMSSGKLDIKTLKKLAKQKLDEEQLRSLKIIPIQKEEESIIDESGRDKSATTQPTQQIIINIEQTIHNKTQINESFNNVKSFVNSSKEMTSSKKKEALKKLDELEKEANKEKPNKKLVSQLWGWIKQNGPRFAETALTKIIEKVIERAI